MLSRKILILLICLSSLIATSQVTIKGTVFDEYLEPFPGAIINSPSGNTTSDYDGLFTIKVGKLPIKLTVSSVGYNPEEIEITEANQEVNIILKESFGLDQVVISASRTPERVMESPVTIERIDKKFTSNTASLNFYEGLKNLKGIDVLDNNYLTKTVVSNRGFASTDNIRFVQLVDGVDTSVPVFEYSLGNSFGVNELDLQNAEILPGAASALYGANAFNGIMLLTTKNPFDYTGISAYAKSGVTTQEDRATKGFQEFGFRFAYKFNDWFAAKANVAYENAEDWLANDNRNINGIGTSHFDGDPSYDGVNVYGDDFSLNLVDLAALINQTTGQDVVSILPAIENAENVRISRTGFQEQDIITDLGVDNIKFDAAFHFRPWGEDKTEIILASKLSVGDNISQASNRYVQTNSSMQQHRFELKGKNYFFRGYYSESDAGKTFDSKLAGVFIGDQLIDNGTYFGTYGAVYFQAIGGGATSDEAHAIARTQVNALLPDADSNEFKQALALAKETPLKEGGAGLFENSGFYNIDTNYNFSEYIDFADIQVGGSFRSFALDSQGQIYTDDDGILRYRQFGFYTQLQKKFAEDRLKFTGTMRYDKSRNFTGKFTPRATLSYAAGKKKDHNFRVGFQTGFRNPTSQDQYVGLNLGQVVLLGSVEDNLTREQVTNTYVSDGVTQVTLSGVDAFENSYTSASVADYQGDLRKSIAESGSLTVVPNFSLLSKADFELVKPETVRSFEVGYRGATKANNNLLEFDLVGYYNIHEDFITSTEVVTPFYGNVGTDPITAGSAIAANDFQRFEISTNAKSTINAYGFSAGFNTKIFGGFNLGGSYAFSDFNLNEVEGDVDFDPAFNTPKHSVKVQFGKEKLFKDFGFAIDGRWQSEFLYQTRFITDRLLPERFVLDAQVNYTIPSWKSTIKLGATNLTGKDYQSAIEAATIGSQYYISWVINNK